MGLMSSQQPRRKLLLLQNARFWRILILSKKNRDILMKKSEILRERYIYEILTALVKNMYIILGIISPAVNPLH